MTTTIDSNSSYRFARFCVTTALAAGLLAGCAAGGPKPSKFAAGAQTALNKGNAATATALAEQAVLADPRNPAFRMLLGTSYLRAGRFEAARQTYDDAMQLGEDSGKAALSLALADVALGRGSDAVDTLNGYRDSIPAADYGLAMAMAGQTATGIAALSDALRHGENTSKVRQNLAYAYALDGSWNEAKLMAAQDVPADKLGARLLEWASMSRPEDGRQRVASLLGVPLRSDGGQPTALALANFPAPEKRADVDAAKAADQSADAAAAASNGTDGAALAKAAVAQLPVVPAQAVPVAAPQPSLADASSAPAGAQLAAIDLPPANIPASAPSQIAGSSHPSHAAPVMAAAPAMGSAPAGLGSHVVQLGSFSSADGAQRAWRHFAARHPALGSYRSQFAEVTVRGHKFWRVQAAGFAGYGLASQMCQSVKAKGGVCLVMATPGNTTPQGRPAETRMARR